MPNLAIAVRACLARHGSTAQQIADHMDRPVDYVLVQVADRRPLAALPGIAHACAHIARTPHFARTR